MPELTFGQLAIRLAELARTEVPLQGSMRFYRM